MPRKGGIKALLDFQRARASFRAAGIDHEVDTLMLWIAITYRRIGDWAQAERYFTRSVERMQDKQDWDRVITDLVQLGYLYDESGKPEKAKASFARAIEVATAHKEPLSAANAASTKVASRIPHTCKVIVCIARL